MDEGMLDAIAAGLRNRIGQLVSQYETEIQTLGVTLTREIENLKAENQALKERIAELEGENVQEEKRTRRS